MIIYLVEIQLSIFCPENYKWLRPGDKSCQLRVWGLLTKQPTFVTIRPQSLLNYDVEGGWNT